MSRLREIVSLILDAAFKIGGLVVFVAQGLSGQAGERPVTLILAGCLMGVGEFVFPYGLIDAIGRRRNGDLVSRALRQKIAFFFVLVIAVGSAGLSYFTHRDVVHLEPQVTQIKKQAAACREEALEDDKRLNNCAHRIAVGLRACRRDQECSSAFVQLQTNAPARATKPEAKPQEVVPGGDDSPSGLEPGRGESPDPENPAGQPSPSPGSEPTSPAPDTDDGTSTAPPPTANPSAPAPEVETPQTPKALLPTVKDTVDTTVDQAQGAVGETVEETCDALGKRLGLC